MPTSSRDCEGLNDRPGSGDLAWETWFGKLGLGVSCLVSRSSYLVSGVSCLASRPSCLVSRLSDLVSRVWCLVSHVWCLIPRISYLVPRVWCPAYGTPRRRGRGRAKPANTGAVKATRKRARFRRDTRETYSDISRGSRSKPSRFPGSKVVPRV